MCEGVGARLHHDGVAAVGAVAHEEALQLRRVGGGVARVDVHGAACADEPVAGRAEHRDAAPCALEQLPHDVRDGRLAVRAGDRRDVERQRRVVEHPRGDPPDEVVRLGVDPDRGEPVVRGELRQVGELALATDEHGRRATRHGVPRVQGAARAQPDERSEEALVRRAPRVEHDVAHDRRRVTEHAPAELRGERADAPRRPRRFWGGKFRSSQVVRPSSASTRPLARSARDGCRFARGQVGPGQLSGREGRRDRDRARAAHRRQRLAVLDAAGRARAATRRPRSDPRPSTRTSRDRSGPRRRSAPGARVHRACARWRTSTTCSRSRGGGRSARAAARARAARRVDMRVPSSACCASAGSSTCRHISVGTFSVVPVFVPIHASSGCMLGWAILSPVPIVAPRFIIARTSSHARCESTRRPFSSSSSHASVPCSTAVERRSERRSPPRATVASASACCHSVTPISWPKATDAWV